jgi:uncharacterized protein
VKLKVPDLSEEVRELEFVVPEQSLNLRLGLERRPSSVNFVGPMAVEAQIYRTGDELYFSGSLAGALTVACRRCLEDFDQSRERDFRFVIVKNDGGDDRDDEGVDHYVGDEIDLEPLVVEQALLAIDTGSDLCSESCRGLCAGCGINLNEEACDCAAPSVES